MKLQALTRHWKLIILIFGVLLMVAGLFWYLWENHNIGINKEYRLEKTVMRYSELIEIGQHEEVFNQYLTAESKSKTKAGRKEIPMTAEEKQAENERLAACRQGSASSRLICRWDAEHKRRFEDIQIPAIQTFKDYAKERKDNWTNIEIEKIIYPDNDRADVRLKVKDKKHSDTAPIETWYLVKGEWLRDF